MKRLLLILFCILIGLKSSMASTNKISDEKLMELLEQANEFEAQNNFESAISIYNEALKIASWLEAIHALCCDGIWNYFHRPFNRDRSSIIITSRDGCVLGRS